jgi:hypothetical protein
MRWAGHVARTEKTVHTLLIGKGEGKGQLGRSCVRLQEDIKVDLLEIGWGDVDWVPSSVGLVHVDLRFV